MSHTVEPKVFIVAESRFNSSPLAAFLEDAALPEVPTHAAEGLTSLAGQVLTQGMPLTADGAFDYIQGLISEGSYWALEHATVTFGFVGVSRTFASFLAELRVGASSITGPTPDYRDLGFFVPQVIKNNPDLAEIYDEGIAQMEDIQRRLVEASRFANATHSMQGWLANAFVRLVGPGAATTAMATFNHRALRKAIQKATHPNSDEEARAVFGLVFAQVADKFPAIYADSERQMVHGHWAISFVNSEV